MNQTYRTLALLGLATVLTGLPQVVAAQRPPASLVLSADTKPGQMSAVELYNRGVDKLDTGDYQGAIADFTQALQLNPNDADTYYNRGYAQHTLGDYDKAITDYSEAIRLNPNFTQAFSNRAYAYYLLKKYPEAI